MWAGNTAAEVVGAEILAPEAEGFLLMTGEAWFEPVPVEGTNSGLAGFSAVDVEDAGNLG